MNDMIRTKTVLRRARFAAMAAAAFVLVSACATGGS